MGSTSNYLGVIFSACLLVLGTSIESTVKRMEKEKSLEREGNKSSVCN
jgi:hypothetical protein